LGYYTMAQTSFLLYLSVILGMAGCMAWSVTEDELAERQVCGEGRGMTITEEGWVMGTIYKSDEM